jgi:hypothetical protein
MGEPIAAFSAWPIEKGFLNIFERRKQVSYPVLPTKNELTFKVLTTSK